MNFDQLKLLPGTVLHLEFHQSNPDTKEPSTLIGYLKNQCIVVSIPMHQGQPRALQLGELVDVTLYSEQLNCSVMFSVQVVNIIDQPLPHAYLSFPVFIARDEARKAQRISTSLIANVKTSAVTVPARIVDVSVSGCKLTAKQDLGAVETPLALATKLSINGHEKIIRLKGRIKGVLAKPAGEGEDFEYGVLFTAVTKEATSLLEQYIDEVSSA
ncbi:flagellar brake protein [Simiduia curdlanivorans]|uniref:Flagellar brake protein n=1 Tax=Simiduia curdlanivorans TaxID=1492769 RepID=A0ABV8V400_9GAMM|nr:flagellar brake protein [Simiduia curdlanivorans]MDN3640001.1 flagellar brake protein [Simiduia curdlanivorans]